MAEREGFPINQGKKSEDNIASILVACLDKNFSSMQSQLGKMIESLEKQNKYNKNSGTDSKELKKFSTELGKGEKEISKFIKSLQDVEKDAWRSKLSDVEDSREKLRILANKAEDQYQQKLIKFSQELSEKQKKLDELKSKEESGTSSAIQSLEREIESLKSTISISSTQEKESLKRLSEITEKTSELDSTIKGLPSIKNKLAEKPLSDSELVSKGLDSVRNKILTVITERDRAHAESARLGAELLKPGIDEEVDEERQEELQREKEINDLKFQNLSIELQNLVEQERLYKEWSPVKDVMAEAGENLKKAGIDLIKTLGSKVLDKFKSYYLDAYKEGFERVYSSIESTRNEISARLRMNQGDFSDLQNQIQSEIEALGYDSTVTQSAVNEAIVSLEKSGITDRQMLKDLAVESAVLAAQGSSFDMSNEETLQNIISYVSREMQGGKDYATAMNEVISIIDGMAANQVLIREEFGNDMASINQGLNTTFNETFKRQVALGRDWQEISDAINAQMISAQELWNANLDPQLISSMINDIYQKSPMEYSTMLKTLMVDLGLDNLLDMSEADQINAITNRMYELFQDKDEKFLSYLDNNIYGTGIGAQNLRIMQQAGGPVGQVADVGSSEYRQQLRQTQEQTKAALQTADYLSRTQSHNNKAENFMTETAIEMEKMYNGDQYIKDAFDLANKTLDSILEAVSSVGLSMLKGVFEGGTSALTKNLSVGDLTSGSMTFLTGGYGQEASALGTAGTVAGQLVGATMAISSLAKNISEDKPIEEVLLDKQLLQGVGVTIGSTVAGPIGGAVAGAAVEVGTLIYEKSGLKEWAEEIDDPIRDAADQLIEAANKQIDAAQQQIDSINTQLSDMQTWSSERKKYYLQQNGLASKEELNNITDEELNEMFDSVVKQDLQNKLLEQENLINQQELIARQAIDVASANEALYTTEEEEEAYKKLKGLSSEDILTDAITGKYKDITQSDLEDYWDWVATDLNEAIKSGNLSDEEIEQMKKDRLVSYSETWKDYFDPTSEEARQNYIGYMTKYGALDAFAAISDIENMSEEDLSELASKKGIDTSGLSADEIREAVIRQSQAERGFTSYTAQDTEMYQYEEWKRRKSIYDEADSEFGKKWSAFVEKYKKENNIQGDFDVRSNLEALAYAYANENNLENGDSFYKGLYFDESGNIHLGTNDDWYLDNYAGKYESGLTRVPVDNYPALLHKGERILTAQEAKAYNELSSYAIRQLEQNAYNTSSSNVLSTNSYGLGNFDTSISNQTTTLSSILKQILQVLQSMQLSSSFSRRSSVAHTNVVKGNTNVYELNTL